MSCSRCNSSPCLSNCPSKNGLAYDNIGMALSKLRLQSPIPNVISDPTTIQKWFRKTKYLPYAGHSNKSNHVYLKYLNSLASLSPSLSACINKIGFYSFGSKPIITKGKDSEFTFIDNLNGKAILQTEEGDVVDKLNSINKFNVSWSSIAEELYKSYKNNGNCYLYLCIDKIMGNYFPSIKVLKQENVLYNIVDLFSQPSIDHSLSWDERYIAKYIPENIPVYPAYSETSKKIKTVIHLKNGIDTYGRPDWLACADAAFLEIKDIQFLLKAVHNDFMGQTLIEFEGAESDDTLSDKDAQDEGHESESERFAANYTNGGNRNEEGAGNTVILAERPFGASPAFVHDFKPNTKEKYFQTIGEMCEEFILKTNSVSKTFIGTQPPKGFSTDAQMSELESNVPLLKYFQDKIMGVINTGLDYIGTVTEDQFFVDYNIEMENPLDVIGRLKPKQKTDAQPNQ